jgi:hypothetical protein
MTQAQKAEKPAESCAGELLWNVSLLPVARPAQPPAPLAVVIELQEAVRRRNAA